MQHDTFWMVDSGRFTWRPRRARGAWAARSAAATAALILGLIAQPLAQVPAPAGGAAPALAVGGDVQHPLSLTPADIKAMPRTTVTVSDEGRDVKYEGVLVGEV